MKNIWRKYHRAIVAGATVVLLIVGAAVALYAVNGEDEAPKEVTSAWPVAESEREIPKPKAEPRWPLTGELASDTEAVKVRPVAVKIENSPASRPQWGIQRADVVYESETEGGITRFNAIYHSDRSGEVGPVRSARLSDVTIVPQYDALFAFSGASSTVMGRVRKAGIPNLSQDAGVSAPYYRKSGRRGPHNLWMVFDKVLAEAESRKMRMTSEVAGFRSITSSADSTVSVSEIYIPFSDANRVTWNYDREAGKYLRKNNGSVHTDAETGKQVSAENVVVLWAKYTVASRDKFGSVTYDVELAGKGRATVFRNGQRFDGQWVADEKSPPRFLDSEGNPIKLSPGNTWVQVVRNNVNITMK